MVVLQRYWRWCNAAHNRYWTFDTVYKKNYSFVLSEKDGKALPVGNDSFWVDLFTQAREWNLIVYASLILLFLTKKFSSKKFKHRSTDGEFDELSIPHFTFNFWTFLRAQEPLLQ